MPTEKPRVTFTIKQEILDKVDEFRYATKAKNQSQAILSLLEKGLEEAEQKTKKSPLYSSEAMDIAKRYSDLDVYGKNTVRAVIDAEENRIKKMAELESPAENTERKVIPLFGAHFAAGPGEPDFGNAWEEYTVPKSSPADFAIHITGDSMEPYLHDGQIALGIRRAPKDGEVGAFNLDGDYLCKQVCTDVNGTIYLFSLNRNRADMDVTIQRDSGRSLTYFGTIIMDQKPPLP